MLGKTSKAPRSDANAEGQTQNAEAGDKIAEDAENLKSEDERIKDGDNPESSGTGKNESEIIDDEQDGGISGLEQALAAERDKYLRLAAEYDNFRKRSIKERETTYSDARADTITRLLPVYDNLERALKMECADEAFYKGVEMTLTGLTEILESMNIKRIEAVGEPFDPNRHNAIMTIEKPGLGEQIVAEECQKGFMLGDRVIRFSTVVVAN